MTETEDEMTMRIPPKTNREHDLELRCTGRNGNYCFSITLPDAHDKRLFSRSAEYGGRIEMVGGRAKRGISSMATLHAIRKGSIQLSEYARFPEMQSVMVYCDNEDAVKYMRGDKSCPHEIVADEVARTEEQTSIFDSVTFKLVGNLHLPLVNEVASEVKNTQLDSTAEFLADWEGRLE